MLGYPEGNPIWKAILQDLHRTECDITELLFEPTLMEMSTREAWQLYGASVRAELTEAAAHTARLIARLVRGA